MNDPQSCSRRRRRVRIAAFNLLAVAAIVGWTRAASAQLLEIEFRSIDGSGNNVANPLLGAADTPLLRQLGVGYADGVASPAGPTRPSARGVSNDVCTQPLPLPNARGVSDLVWQWGQFLDHDIDLTGPAIPAEPFNIDVPVGDPFFDPHAVGGREIRLDRSVHTSIDGVRQQINQITSFVDASNVYGSNVVRANALRRFRKGELRKGRRRTLPRNTLGLPNAGGSENSSLFLAGDVRANEQVGLTAMHTLFMREHNRIARRLRPILKLAGEETVFQLARMIVAAEMQAITYNEFLPALLGEDALAGYTGYDPAIDPRVSNEFSTAAYRFGHSMLSPLLLRIGRRGRPAREGHLELKDAFFAPHELRRGRIDTILRGLVTQRAQTVDPFIVDAVRNFLFGPPGSDGLDLASLNIQRARDHGLPSYNQARRDLGLSAAARFADISSNPEVRRRLAAAYASVEEVDLWVGGLAEDHVGSALVGETFFLIIKDQFERLRDGDRFWYQRYLSADLVAFVEARSLRHIIEDNSRVRRDELQANVFFVR